LVDLVQCPSLAAMIHGGTDDYVTDPARATGPVSIRFAMALVLLP
jgi:Cu/Zn superoxide dismutase